MAEVAGLSATDAGRSAVRPKNKQWRAREKVWRSVYDAMRRCRDPEHKDYRWYGGRGITFDFASVIEAREYLLAELGPCPVGKSLDRKDNDGPYGRGNLRWATGDEQRANKRAPVRLRLCDGRSASAVARANGISERCFEGRRERGWSVDRAATEPVKARRVKRRTD